MPRTLATACRKLTSSFENVRRFVVCAPRTPYGPSPVGMMTLMPLTTPCSCSSGGPLKRVSVRRSSTIDRLVGKKRVSGLGIRARSHGRVADESFLPADARSKEQMLCRPEASSSTLQYSTSRVCATRTTASSSTLPECSLRSAS